MSDNYYDDTLAELYDSSPLLSVSDDHPSIGYFRHLAAKYGGPVLLIGAATGKFALPILRDGHDVVGVDVSQSTLNVLHAKLSTELSVVRDRFRSVIGDMRTLQLESQFPLVLLPGNVFMYNLTQRDQIATLKAMARHLVGDGVVALDVFTLDQRVLAADRPMLSWHRFRTESGMEYLAEQVVEVDHLHQLERMRMVHRPIGADGALAQGTVSELTMRYIQPAEMILLCRAAGLRIVQFSGDYGSSAPKSRYEGPQLVVAERGD